MSIPEELQYVTEIYPPTNKPVKAGFILPDGTVIEIYEDDHSIINENLRNKYNLLSYRYAGKELNIRIYNKLTPAQIMKFLGTKPIQALYVDFYKNGKYIDSRSYEGYLTDAKIMNLLEKWAKEVLE